MALSAASLSDPLRVVDSLFAEHCRKAEASQAGPGTAPPAQPQIDQDWGVAAHFEALLSSNAQSVPSLTKRALRAGELTPGMLVRYRGMIQDAFDPEYFQAESHCIEEATGKAVRVTCKYRDTLHVPEGCKPAQGNEGRARGGDVGVEGEGSNRVEKAWVRRR